MKLEYRPIAENSIDMIHVNRTDRPYRGMNWHFHQEYELIYFLEGQGMRIVGDHISNFKRGELVLVGEWLPHLWRNDSSPASDVPSDFIIVKFLKEFQGTKFFSIGELALINQLLSRSSRGLFFDGPILDEVHDVILQLSESSSTQRLITFIQLLHILSQSENAQPLASINFTLATGGEREDRLSRVINYIFNNFKNDITLNEMAKYSFMTPSAFCRFFKKRTNKTFIQFLNEFRVGKSCQLLANGRMSVKQICYEAGFSSLTNFNRTFKALRGMSPTEFRTKYQL